MILILLLLFLGIVVWLWYHHPSYVITWWNRLIKSECDGQDASSLNGIPSYQNAWNADNKSVVELHRLIHINHDEILTEVVEMISNLETSEEKDFTPKWLKEENQWNPIWIRYMGDWVGPIEKLPTLKRIISLFPEVTMFYISVFPPGSTVVEHQGLFRAVQKYHYGLKVPDGDVGLKIADFDVQWKEKEGFIWDDTLSHSAWNHSSESRIVLFADVLRDFSVLNSIGSHLLYILLRKSKPALQVKSRLQT